MKYRKAIQKITNINCVLFRILNTQTSISIVPEKATICDNQFTILSIHFATFPIHYIQLTNCHARKCSNEYQIIVESV